MNISLGFRRIGALIIASLLLNGLFLWWNFKNKEYCAGTLHAHGEVAYNFYKYNSITINPDRLAYVAALQKKSPDLVDYADINHESFGPPSAYRSIYDTIGYGILLGLAWKLTHSLRYLDLQILQIVIFSLLMILVYYLALMFFSSSLCAYFCSWAHLFFFPLIFQNIQAHRDIWAYYGVLIFLFALVAFMQGKTTSFSLVGIFSFFALIQFIRPLIFFTPLAVLGLLFCYALIHRIMLIPLLTVILIFVVTNLLFFWLPFGLYNSVAYQRALLMPSGLGLVEGLGEFDNPWGYKLDDEWFGRFMNQHYGLQAGTVECDDVAKNLFAERVKENPLFFIKNVGKRLVQVLLPNLPWSFYPEHLYAGVNSFKAKIKRASSSPTLFFDFIFRLLYVRLFILVAYAGVIYALIRKKYWEVLIGFGVVCSSFSILPSHIEYRYLVPFYGVFALFAGYFAYEIYELIQSRVYYKEKRCEEPTSFSL